MPGDIKRKRPQITSKLTHKDNCSRHKCILFLNLRQYSKVRRFFGKPKKIDVFWKPKYSMLLLEKNRKKRGGNGGKTKKNRYFTKIEPYLYEFVANESSFGIYTRKTKEILFEI